MTIRNLDKLLHPRSVLLIGPLADAAPADRGPETRHARSLWRNLRSGGFRGPCLALDPAGGLLDGQPLPSRLEELPEGLDLALLCTPPDALADWVRALGARGTRAVIVSGGNPSPAQRQAALEAARPHQLRLLGPNGLGLQSPALGLNASAAHTQALPGHIAFISQSGTLVSAMLDWAKSRNFGFSHLVSIGERMDVDAADLLDQFAIEGRTRAILLYLESIDQPRKFMSAARAASRGKPVIVVKAGRSPGGQLAAVSHTGQLSGADIVFDAAIRRAGMLRVDTLQELFLAAQTLSQLHGHLRERLTVLTNGGGAGVIAADAAEHHGVPLHALDAALQARLAPLLPPGATPGNPVDLGADATAARQAEALEALLDDPETGSVLMLHAPAAGIDCTALAETLLPVARRHPGRVLGCWLGGAAMDEARSRFTAAGIPDHATPEDAVRALAMLRTWRENQAALMETPGLVQIAAPQRERAQAVIDRALAEGRELLDDEEAMALLKAYGVEVVATRRVAPEAAAVLAAAQSIGYPVVLKIASRDIVHKSDVGGVVLGLHDPQELEAAVAALLGRVRARAPQARIDALTVQAMVRRPHARELIVGASIDPLFGPVLLFGAGGTAVEVLADRAVALPPLNRALAADLVRRTRVARLLAGFRDHPPARLEAVYDTLIAVARLVAELPAIAELDLNPVLADADGALAVDVRVRIAAAGPGGREHFAIRPYPSAWVQTVVWRGRKLVVRPIRPEDEAAHSAFIQSLDPTDRRMRFFSTRRSAFAHVELARMTQIDYAREMAFIASTDPDPAKAQTLGVVRAITDPDNQAAEYAIVIRSELKGTGLGRLLMLRIIDYVRSRGTRRIVGEVLRENRGMLKLLGQLGFRAVRDPEDDELMRVTLELDGPPAPAP